MRLLVMGILSVVGIVAVACDGDSSADSTDSPSPTSSSAPASSQPSGWECFNVGLYDTSLCRIESGDLVLSGIGETIVATQEAAYPSCPDGWTANDDGQLCVPPSGWQADVQSGAATLSSSDGVQVRIDSEPVNVLPEKCDPVYVFGLVLGGSATTAEWCVSLGQRYAHISVPAGLLGPDYYEAFQVALSAGE